MNKFMLVSRSLVCSFPRQQQKETAVANCGYNLLCVFRLPLLMLIKAAMFYAFVKCDLCIGDVHA